MAEVEFAGLKVSGGKLLLAIPFAGSVIAAMWGGFELYQRLVDRRAGNNRVRLARL